MAAFFKIMIVVIALLAIAFVGMAISILIKKNGKFPESEIGKNKAMAQKGIRCVKHDEMKEFRKMKKKAGVNIPDGGGCCGGCHD